MLHCGILLKFLGSFQFSVKRNKNADSLHEGFTCVSALFLRALLAKYLSERKTFRKILVQEKAGNGVVRDVERRLNKAFFAIGMSCGVTAYA